MYIGKFVGVPESSMQMHRASSLPLPPRVPPSPRPATCHKIFSFCPTKIYIWTFLRLLKVSSFQGCYVTYIIHMLSSSFLLGVSSEHGLQHEFESGWSAPGCHRCLGKPLSLGCPIFQTQKILEFKGTCTYIILKTGFYVFKRIVAC